MRRTGHIRQRSNNSFEIRYSAGRDSLTGNRRVATTTVRGTRKDAERELRRLLRAVDTGEHVDPGRMTLAAWLRQWHQGKRAEVSPKTHERYGEIVENFLIPKLGALPLAKLGPVQIEKAYSDWAVGGRLDGRAGPLSPLTRRYIHVILRSALARAVEQKLLARNPADIFRKRLPKVERKEMTTHSPEQSLTLLDSLKNSRTYWPALIALASGMRRGEVLALRWKHVDFSRKTISVGQSLEQTKEGLRSTPLKNSSA